MKHITILLGVAALATGIFYTQAFLMGFGVGMIGQYLYKRLK